MKSIKLESTQAYKLVFTALVAAVPCVAGAGSSPPLDIHGWAIEDVAAKPFVGTSLSMDSEDGLGFSDPRAGQGDYGSRYVGTSLRVDDGGELGFTDPRPGE